MRLRDSCRGRWRDILTRYGLGDFLNRKHGPCPFCGGVDRYRWDDRGGDGTFFCAQCGPGDGLEMLMRHTGQTFARLAPEIEAIVGECSVETRKVKSDDDLRAERVAVWRAGKPIQTGGSVWRYLEARNCFPAVLPQSLRETEGILIAAVQEPGGRCANIHRTWVADRRKLLMAGSIPDGSAIRLGPISETMGIAEGIETALSASRIFGVPVWAGISAGIMAKWVPPDDCRRVMVFGDNDVNFTGQAAAYRLANRLARDREASVHIPDVVGDWNDVIPDAL